MSGNPSPLSRSGQNVKAYVAGAKLVKTDAALMGAGRVIAEVTGVGVVGGGRKPGIMKPGLSGESKENQLGLELGLGSLSGESKGNILEGS